MTSSLSLPASLRQFFALFPLYTHGPVLSPYTAKPVRSPTLWIHSPWDAEADVLSSDVECLKWQAYLALRGVTDVDVRWDMASEGAIDARLPNLHVPPKEGEAGGGDLLPAHLIREWVDGRVGGGEGPLEGYVDEAARDEGRAWVALMEGNVHAALTISEPPSFNLWNILSPYSEKPRSVETMINPPPAPFTGISSLLPPYGSHVDRATIELQYREAIASLSERLGTDKWFLGSTGPTALDALIFAYLHRILHAKDNTIRFEVTRRVNLVAWERRVQSQVRAAFQRIAP
ncbi:hypothetical protein SCP_0401380 [Sparassis crispa]|uniref:Metaxin glutathione S-transferase domain-containing protein n=1 Tax=Sparassis crispa TaxID=139825 RepID=A0A401GI30_9APHY|nr:hypothetical protein SCP_0401380 [Sparassis crispa]GBE81765.1 hypothetical protein SCP_0401380 [Sparassis crispa]